MNDLYSVNGNRLDEAQVKVLLSNSKNILVIAGAGSGKSTTIIGKIHYLIETLNVKEEEILCISFTNESCNSLHDKLNKYYGYDIEVLTFHKLALKILKNSNVRYDIVSSDMLSYLIDEYFEGVIYGEEVFMFSVIKYFKIYVTDDISRVYKKIPIGKINELKKLIYSYICFFKTNGFDYEYLINLINIEKNKLFLFSRRKLYFLYLVIRILYEYDIELKSEEKIDFDDMIVLATEVIENSNLSVFKYKYIIVDEFQDTSILRYNLINLLVKKCDSNFIVVGDDYQSIYGFSGCDLSLFLKLGIVDESGFDIIKIQNTYRNSNELVKVASNFVSKDRALIRKELCSCKSVKYPIKIIYYDDEKLCFKRLIDYLCSLGLNKILILGRNNNDIYKCINDDFEFANDVLVYKKNRDISLRYLTVHKSKGLEEENVIIISLFDGKYGFPCKVKNDKLLRDVMIGSQMNSYEEERRLFYVALTRTKNYVYLFTSRSSPSMFVKELLMTERDSIEVINL